MTTTPPRVLDLNTADGMFEHLSTLPTENLRAIAARPVFNAESVVMVVTAEAILATR